MSSVKSSESGNLSDIFSSMTSCTASTSGANRLKKKGKVNKDKSIVSKISRSQYGSNKENSASQKTLLSLLTRGRITQKLGLYGKGKSSETITRRTVLGVRSSSNKHCTNYCTLNNCSDSSSISHIKSSREIPRSPEQLKSYDPESKEVIQCQLLPENNISQMEVSPKSDTDSVLMTKFARRILGGLQADKSINTEDYISDIKRELRKVMKQSDPTAYTEIKSCLSNKKQHITQSDPLPQPEVQSPSFHLSSLQSQDNTLIDSSFPSSDDVNPTSFVATTANLDNLYPSIFLGNMLSGASNQLDLWSSSHVTDSSHLNNSDPCFPLIQEPQDMDQSCPSFLQTVPVPETDSNSCVEGSSDFLDILDKGLSMQVQNSVERPRMFPHKLY